MHDATVSLPLFPLHTVLVPGEVAELIMTGPAAASLGGSSLLSVALYDVVTDTDAAGDPIRRENFHWDYLVAHEVLDTVIPIKVRYELQ